MELWLFGLFIAAHIGHGLLVFFRAEELERRKLSGQYDNGRFNAATRYLFAGTLFLPGFIWADFRWLWLALASYTIFAGLFVLILASAQEETTLPARKQVPESFIRERAQERRYGLILRIFLVLLWIYAWRAYL